MNSMMPLKAVKDSCSKDAARQSNVFNEALNNLTPNPLSKKINYAKVANSQSGEIVDLKQVISGCFDGQVIKDLPEEGVKILFADQNLRQQYYDLRHKIFTEVDEAYRAKHPEDCQDWEDYDGSEIEDDRCGRVLVAIDNDGKVVAGVRFLVNHWIKHTANEVPEVGFTIRNFFEKVGLNRNARYVELEDVVIEKGFRNRTIMKSIFSILIDETKKFGCEYLIGISIKSASRNHKMLFNNLGCRMDVMLNYPWIRQKNHGYEIRYPVVAYFKE
jgi:hypothetical protein